MKPAGLPLLALVLAGPMEGQSPAEPPPAVEQGGLVKTSSRISAEIRATLPKFTPPPPPMLDQPKDIESDPDVLRLPKFTVKEKRLPTHDPDVWLTDKAVPQKAMAAYKQSLTDFEWALNSWYIPLFGSPPSARARAAYANQKKMSELQRIHNLFQAISNVSPRSGAELEQERVKMEQAEYWQRRPAGDGRSK